MGDQRSPCVWLLQRARASSSSTTSVGKKKNKGGSKPSSPAVPPAQLAQQPPAMKIADAPPLQPAYEPAAAQRHHANGVASAQLYGQGIRKALAPKMCLSPRAPDVFEHAADIKHECKNAQIVHQVENGRKMRHDEGLTLTPCRKMMDSIYPEDGSSSVHSVWLDNICVCHLKAAKLMGAQPMDQCMPSQHGESFFEGSTAEKAAELMGEAGAVEDIEDLMACLPEVLNGANGGTHELCACKCELGEGPMPWVASYVDGMCEFQPLRTRQSQLADYIYRLRLQRNPPVDPEYEAWLDDAHEKAEELRRSNAAKRIWRWWLALWEENLETAMHTAQWMESEDAKELISDHTGESAEIQKVDESALHSLLAEHAGDTPWYNLAAFASK